MAIQHLPTQTTLFIGRTKELTDLSALLPEYRLVTLVGPGGIGKTLLALETAAQLRSYRDGTFFVPLQPLDSSAHIVPTIADVLDVKFSILSNEDPKTQLLNYLRRKNLLLVLDNFDHLLDGGEIVNELLTQAPQVSVLVTSRERLNLVGETVYPLQGMSIPKDAMLDQISTYSAVQLFIECATRIRPGFRLTESDAYHVADICRLVDGVPLAIVMAAVWIHVLSPAEIVSEIQQSLDFLEVETRDIPVRHRSMRAVFDQSWRLLTDDEQTVFTRLTVFRGGFTREAAQVVADAKLRTLSSLVNKSLLHRDANSGRYEFHELLRQYGESKFQSSGQFEETRQAHIAYFVDFMERQWLRSKTPERLNVLNEIERDFENIRLAWFVSIEQGRSEELRKMASGLWTFLEARDRYFEGSELFEQALEVVRDPSYARGHLLGCLGLFSVAYREFEKWEIVTREALDLLASTDIIDELLIAYLSRACGLEDSGRSPEAIDVAKAGFKLADMNHDLWFTCSFLELWGRVLVWLETESDIIEAVKIGEKALALMDQIGDYCLRSGIYGHIFAVAAYQKGNLAEALKWLETALQEAETVNKLGIASGYHHMLAWIAIVYEDYTKARFHAYHGLKAAIKMNLLWPVLNRFFIFTHLLIQQGEPERAIELFALVARHPDTPSKSKLDAEAKLTKLKASMAEAVYEAAITRGMHLDLYDAAEILLQEFDPARDSAHNSHGLSPREMDVLKLLVAGCSNREIAKEMIYALGTVKWYISQIYSKLGVESRTQAIAKARELNLF